MGHTMKEDGGRARGEVRDDLSEAHFVTDDHPGLLGVLGKPALDAGAVLAERLVGRDPGDLASVQRPETMSVLD
jgi:hypothetical protein